MCLRGYCVVHSLLIWKQPRGINFQSTWEQRVMYITTGMPAKLNWIKQHKKYFWLVIHSGCFIIMMHLRHLCDSSLYPEIDIIKFVCNSDITRVTSIKIEIFCFLVKNDKKFPMNWRIRTHYTIVHTIFNALFSLPVNNLCGFLSHRNNVLWFTWAR